ncbi:MAG: glycosyltransferase family 2 protein [Gammaproteobacteria bacterium]|nr:glycosyltransferase family 2 protein [Gammaproteobacteria bacterium]
MEISDQLSIILPAKNESANLAAHLNEIRTLYPMAELIVVNDGSEDDTGAIAEAAGARVISHPYSMGNGAAIKSGARAASGKYLLFMDADGQHQPADISKLIEQLGHGFSMVIGAREPTSHASRPRRVMNFLYNKIASIMTGFEIFDLTSGFRLVEARFFRQFLYLLPNGFSYPTTITMAFLRSGYPIKFIWIHARQREGKSNIRPLKDGIRFMLIILKVGALFSPMRLFLPISAGIFTTGIAYYGFTYLTQGRFTNMSAVLFLAALIIFLIGIIGEQISSLHYQASQDRE